MRNGFYILGYLTKDPDMKYMPSGVALVTTSIASTEKRGETEHTLFMPIKVWGKAAEFLAENAKKGELLFAEGMLQTEKWVNREGENRERIVLNVESYRLLNLPPSKKKTKSTAFKVEEEG